MTDDQDTTLALLLALGVVALILWGGLPAKLAVLFHYHPTPQLTLNPFAGLTLPTIQLPGGQPIQLAPKPGGIPAGVTP